MSELQIDPQLQNRISSLNKELTLLRTVGNKHDLSQQQFKGLWNINLLAQRLKKTNEALRYTNQEKEAATERMKSQGIDLNPVINKLKHTLPTQPLKKPARELWVYLEHEPIHLGNQMELIQRARRLAATTALTITLNRKQNQIMRTLRKKFNKRQQPTMEVSSMHQITVVEKEKIYNQCVDQCLRNKKMDMLHCDLFKSFTVRKMPWLELLVKQIQALYEANDKKREFKTAVNIESLRCFEFQFRKQFKREDALEYLRTHYLIEREQNTPIHYQNGIEVWGLAYILYRAGLKQDFYLLLRQLKKINLRKQFEQYDQRILNGQPKPSQNINIENISDIFYRQLVAILVGDQNYRTDNVFSFVHDDIYMLLCLKSIYNRNIQEEKKYILDVYEESSLQCLRNLIALRAYSEANNYCNDILLNRDSQMYSHADHVHFMLLLWLNPELYQDSTHAAQLTLYAVQTIIKYAKTLRNKNNNTFLSYIAVLFVDYSIQSSHLNNVSRLFFKQIFDIVSFPWGNFCQIMQDKKKIAHLLLQNALNRIQIKDIQTFHQIEKIFSNQMKNNVRANQIKLQSILRCALQNKPIKEISFYVNITKEEEIFIQFIKVYFQIKKNQKVNNWLYMNRQFEEKITSLLSYLVKKKKLILYINFLIKVIEQKQYQTHLKSDIKTIKQEKNKMNKRMQFLMQEYPQIQEYVQWERLREKVINIL